MTEASPLPVTPVPSLPGASHDHATHCSRCRAPVAVDQRYCLNCGMRQSGALDPPHPARGPGGRDDFRPPPPVAEPPSRDWTPAIALGGLLALALVLVVGVLIGRTGQPVPSKVAAAPQVITVQGGAAGAAAPTAAAPGARQPVTTISSDWPSGKSGWTVELETLAKPGSTAAAVNAAKSAAASKGATGIGVLDASKYSSLGGDYVIYSGDLPSRAVANAALAKLKSSFPGARVIHVVPPGSAVPSVKAAPVSQSQQKSGKQTIQSLSNCSGTACSKAARKVTKPVATPGQAPKVDHKAAGGGTAAQGFQ